MDSKAWLWKKKSTEKTIILTEDRANLSTNSNEEEKRLNYKARHEQDLNSLNEKLSASISECNAREAFAKKQGNLAQEAIAGWEKAEAEVKTLKLELDKSLQQRVASEEKSNLLDGALKECMQQLRFDREDQEKTICDAVKRAKLESDEKLAETIKRVAKVEAENIKLGKTLMSKEKVIAELCSLKARAEADYVALMARIESTEKENCSLMYEVHLLQKELEIRNEEREFNCRTSSASHKQHLENVKRIAKLEQECHRLRLLVRKRLPGPAALAQMKNEVKLLDKDHQLETTMIKRSNSSLIGSTDFGLHTEQSLIVEKGNVFVKEDLIKTRNAASALSNHDGSLSMASISEMDSDDKVSCTGSWASALVSELEQFKNGKEASKASSISVGFSEMSLMDDFVQMEKLAVVSAENSYESNNQGTQILEGSPLKTPLSSSLMETCNNTIQAKKGNQKPNSSLSISMHKIIELIEGISMQLPQDCASEMVSTKDERCSNYNCPETSRGYVRRVFQWKSSELSTTLEQFLQACNDFLNEKSNIEHFADHLVCTLAWVLDHCFSLQDVSSMKYAIKNSFAWDEKSESELENGAINQEKELLSSTLASATFFQNSQFQEEPIQLNNYEYPKSAENDSSKRNSEREIQDDLLKSEQQPESSKSIEEWQMEVDTTKQLTEETEDRSEADKLVQDDHITELSNAKNDLIESPKTQKSQDTKLENRSDAFENSGQVNVDNKEVEDDMERIRMQLRTDMEITAASEKLAECQETILNLGKQLKALAPQNGNALSSSTVINTASLDKKASDHTTLLDKMLAEDNADIEVLGPKTDQHKTPETLKRLTDTIRADNGKSSSVVNGYSAGSGKKRSGGLLMKLFCSERKSSCKQIDVMKS